MHLKLAAGNGGFSRVIQPVAAAGSDPAQLRADCVLHEPAPPHRLAWRGALPQHILSYSDIRKGVRPALRCRVRANAFKLGGRENLSDGASGDQPDQ